MHEKFSTWIRLFFSALCCFLMSSGKDELQLFETGITHRSSLSKRTQVTASISELLCAANLMMLRFQDLNLDLVKIKALKTYRLACMLESIFFVESTFYLLE